MEKYDNNHTRIVWIDIFKALCIIFVVIGHSTGKFNHFIYLFHIPAFFFIAGYTTGIKRRSFIGTVYDRFYRLFLPLLIIFLFLLGVALLLNKINLYDNVFSIEYIGALNSLKMFFTRGDIYMPWLGACWFIFALIGISCLVKALDCLSGSKQRNILLIISIVFFFIGLYVSGRRIPLRTLMFSYNIIFVGQFYYVLGLFAKKYDLISRIMPSLKRQIICFLFSFGALLVCGILNMPIVSFPDYQYSPYYYQIPIFTISVILLSSSSLLLSNVHKKILAILVYIGKNTMCIMIFHFIAFKIFYGILILLGQMSTEQFSNLTPPTEIGNVWWWAFSALGIGVSLAIWEVLIKIPNINTLLGLNTDFEKTSYLIISNISKKIVKFLPDLLGIKIDICLLIEKLKNFKIMPIFIVSCILTLWPMTQQGIMCNDELQNRFARKFGLLHFVKDNAITQKIKGRMLSIPFDWRFLSFISENMFISRVISVLLIILSILLFCKLIAVITKCNGFAFFTGFLLLIFMPITFEHAVPNAFVTLLAIPMCWLISSLLLYWNYLHLKEIKYILFSSIFFFIALVQYEFIIIYALSYPILYLIFIYQKKNTFSKKDFVKSNLLILLTIALYLFLYFLVRILTNSTYDGNKLQFVSVKSSFDIIKTLFLSAIPGYFLTNTKYQYLFKLYSNDNGNINYFIIPILLVFTLAVVFTLNYIFKAEDFSRRKPNKLKHIIMIIICLLIFMSAPAIPNSISSMYQGIVDDRFFTSLPVSYFIYFSAVLLFSYSIWQILYCMKDKASVFIIFIIILIAVPQQASNYVIANVQRQDYERLEMLEAVFDTGSIGEFDDCTLYAPDFFETRNLLSFQDSYWTQYAGFKNRTITITKDDKLKSQSAGTMEIQGDLILLWKDDAVRVLSLSQKNGTAYIETPDGYVCEIEFGVPLRDGRFYFYGYYWNKVERLLIQFT